MSVSDEYHAKIYSIGLTVFRLQVSVENHVWRLLALDRLCISPKAHDVAANLRRILSIMTAIQRSDKLCKHTPHELFIGALIPQLQLFDHLAQIAIAAVLHIQMQILSRFVVFSLKVSDDVWMPKLLENGKFGLELFALFRGHLGVADLFSAEHLLCEN